MIDFATAAAMLDYSPETGQFRWKVNRTGGIKAGDVAGCLSKEGYVVISIFHRQYFAHRLAWFLTHKEWRTVDHKDCERSNNRLDNLRAATHAQNSRNRRRAKTSKYLKGAFRCRTRSVRFEARLMVDGKVIYLGTFGSELEAHQAYMAEARKRFGEFARAA